MTKCAWCHTDRGVRPCCVADLQYLWLVGNLLNSDNVRRFGFAPPDKVEDDS